MSMMPIRSSIQLFAVNKPSCYRYDGSIVYRKRPMMYTPNSEIFREHGI